MSYDFKSQLLFPLWNIELFSLGYDMVMVTVMVTVQVMVLNYMKMMGTNTEQTKGLCQLL